MDKTFRKFTSHEEARSETYLYWRGRSDAEVFDAIAEMSCDAYREWYKMKGIAPHVERSDRSLTRIEQGPRLGTCPIPDKIRVWLCRWSRKNSSPSKTSRMRNTATGTVFRLPSASLPDIK
jgi:hypothetical protein